jgi:hypothetical protein
VPIYRPSGGIAGTMDLVYYHDGEPVLLVEAKRKYKSPEFALREAENYLRNFPIDDNKFAPTGKRPRYFAISIGRDIKFYHHRVAVFDDGQFAQISEPIDILSFDELLDKCGLIKGYKPKVLDAYTFKKEFLDELASAYNVAKDRRVTPEVVKNVAKHILNYLENKHTYDTRAPFIELKSTLANQEYIKDLHRRFDLVGSLCPEIAQEFRRFILRSFQGKEFNQYLTEECIIVFMLNLIGAINSQWKVLDFECGSGGFLSAVLKKGLQMENILGIDIDNLPFTIAKTYLALYFSKTGKEISQIPIREANGLFYLGNNWDLVVGNPSGSHQYKRSDLKEVLKNLERDLNRDNKDDKFSEYNFSIQQAVRSCKVGGKICLFLPDGFFSNHRDEILRKYVAKHCKVLALISLPRGIFRKGTSTKTINTGSQSSSQKMAILYAEKIKPVIDGEGLEIDSGTLQYPVFIANITKPASTASAICDWLEPRLNLVLEEWRAWQSSHCLTELDEELIKEAESSKIIKQKKKSKKDDSQLKLLSKEPATGKKPKTVKSEVSISEELDELFRKK